MMFEGFMARADSIRGSVRRWRLPPAPCGNTGYYRGHGGGETRRNVTFAVGTRSFPQDAERTALQIAVFGFATAIRVFLFP